VQKALTGLVEAGVLRRTSDPPLHAAAHRGEAQGLMQQAPAAPPPPNSSPNFN
jgi:hypothetical protein